MSGVDVQAADGELLPVCSQRGSAAIARPGQALCDVHASSQRVAAARRRLVLAAPDAAERLIEISETADSADVRRRAAEAILERAGVRGAVEVDVVVGQPEVSPADLLRDRLALLRRRTLEGAAAERSAVEAVQDE